MTCVDCEAAKYTQPHGYPYRWRESNIRITACQAHVKEVMDVLTLFQDIVSAIRKELSLDK